jgi:integrase/recombinase XerD
MFDQLFKRAATISRHETEPFAGERSRYLEYCIQRGDSLESQLRKAYDLLWISRRLSKHFGHGSNSPCFSEQ